MYWRTLGNFVIILLIRKNILFHSSIIIPYTVNSCCTMAIFVYEVSGVN